MAVLQSIPAGYLSLLGIKQGSNPGQAADFVQPVVSLDTFYLATAIDSLRSALVGATNEGDQASLTVPSTEAWRLLAVGFNVNAFSAAAAAVRVAVQLVDPRGGFPVSVMDPMDKAIAATTDAVFSGILFPQPVVVPPGTVIRSYLLNDLGAVTCTLMVTALFQRFTV